MGIPTSASDCGSAGFVSSVVSISSSEVSSWGSCGASGCDCWFLTYCKVSLYGDLPGVGLARSDLNLSIWISMKISSQDSSCDTNVNCAMNVLKFRSGRFQKIVTRTSRSIRAASPRKVQSMIGIVKSHCLSNCRRLLKGMDRLTRDRSVLRCSRMTIGIWSELTGAHNLSN